MKDVLLELDEVFKQYLQHDLEFSVNSKIIKAGKLFLFEHGYFNFIFHIKTKMKSVSLKIPIPFDFVLTPHNVEMNYKIEAFTNNIPAISDAVDRIKVKNPSKFYNNILTIKMVQ